MIKNLVIVKLRDIYYIFLEFIYKICLLIIDIICNCLMFSCRIFIGIVCIGRFDISDVGGELVFRNIIVWIGLFFEGISYFFSDVF